MANELFTAAYWTGTITQAAHFAAGCALAPVLPLAEKLMSGTFVAVSVPWAQMGTGAALGAVVSVCLSVLSIKVPGTLPGSVLPTKLVNGLAAKLSGGSTTDYELGSAHGKITIGKDQ